MRRLALLAKEAGVDGVVGLAARGRARPRGLRPRLPDRDPGHPPGGRRGIGDQARAATPAAALAAGADYLVVGRPITEAADPAAAADRIVREMEQAGR